MGKTSKGRFEWLQDYLELGEHIEFLEWKISKSVAEAQRWSGGDLANMHISGANTRPAQVGRDIEKMEAEERECKLTRRQLVDLVDSFEGLDNEILRMKYIKGMSLEQIADTLHYSYPTIARRHAEIRRRLDWMDAYEKRRQTFQDRLDYTT